MGLLASCAGNVDPEDTGREDDESENDQTVIDSSKDIDSGYLKNHLALVFTSTGCVQCPLLSATIKEIKGSYHETFIPVALHMDYESEDPMTLAVNKKFYEKVSRYDAGMLALPLFSLNFMKDEKNIVSEYAKIESEIKSQQTQYPAICGVSVEAGYDEAAAKINVSAGFKADKAGYYRYHIFLVEDGLDYVQAGVEEAGYRHDNVLRALSADNVLGSKLNSGKVLEPGEEYKVEKSFQLAKGWNHENMRVVAVMMATTDDGQTWISNNANETAIGDKADYEYEK